VRVTGEQPAPFICVAVQAPRASSFEATNGVLTADLDGDGQREFFRSCTSVEGVHLTVWSGAPLTGQRRWHAYHYVGYDMVPSCTPAEIGG
jgi:phage terminase large subunit-like protein